MKTKLKKMTRVIMLATGIGVPAILSTPIDVSATDYGGLCCQKIATSCSHPNGMVFADAQWTPGKQFCP